MPENLESLSVVEPAKELREAIRLIVQAHKGTVKVPVAWNSGDFADTAEQLDQSWNKYGIRVRLDFKHHLAALVADSRKSAGMPPHPLLKSFITFEPADG